MHEKKTSVRYRIRRSDASLMDRFFPWGLLALLFLLLPLIYGLMWFAKNGIETAVETEVQNELTAKSFNWVEVQVDGQEVTLSGKANKPAGDEALAVARAIERPAWFGQFSVPSKVSGEFTEPSTVVTTPTTERTSSAKEVKEEAEKQPDPVWGNFISEVKQGNLVLSGTVASERIKSTLLNVANAQMKTTGVTQVIDQINVSDLQLIPESQDLAQRTIELISKCDSGEARANDGRFSIDCQTSRDKLDDLKTQANQPFKLGNIGRIAISAANECNRVFEQTLQGKSIGFRTGKADLKPASKPLLEQIAQIAQSCPGAIRVEGHTDKTGNFDSNMALSSARANSVVNALVELGVQRERLIPKGFGPTKPRAEGDTREAYALNRRIEFYVSE